jgi:hypothetical protein
MAKQKFKVKFKQNSRKLKKEENEYKHQNGGGKLKRVR